MPETAEQLDRGLGGILTPPANLGDAISWTCDLTHGAVAADRIAVATQLAAMKLSGRLAAPAYAMYLAALTGDPSSRWGSCSSPSSGRSSRKGWDNANPAGRDQYWPVTRGGGSGQVAEIQISAAVGAGAITVLEAAKPVRETLWKDAFSQAVPPLPAA
ncbi:hypothetical protein ACTVZO_43660 [Streptomyces sp. IBSNAI002]|uniref:hypothetical protein n=1 Tax=Streptomyces sp. IBSNAI002 TaxID=3457500 RepID=UPI003FCF12CE